MKGAKKRDKTLIKWDDITEKAFQECKDKIANCTLLNFPNDKADLRLVTDASDTSMGSVLEQKVNSKWEPLAFFSRKFSPAQTKYSTYDRELMAIVESIKHFIHDLEGRPFEVCTDHKLIIYSQTQSHKKAPPHRSRKISYLSEFDIKYTHVKGKHNPVADALSRIDSISTSKVDEVVDPIELLTYPADLSFGRQISAIRFPRIFDEKILSVEQRKDKELKHILNSNTHPLKLQKFTTDSQQAIYCEIRDKVFRPYIPLSLRKDLINLFHSLSHPSARVTDRLIRQKYIWPNLTRDVASYCRTCLRCQTSKVSRNNKTKPAKFDFPDARFQHIHADIVGPLPLSNGYKYIFTMVDRYTRWPEAVPMYDMTAESCAQAFFESWISRFCSPLVITTDQGKQFESAFFNELLKILGSKRIRTTSYHPEPNGVVEKWHRHLKAALMCCAISTDWYYTLPMVMLGLRTALRSDTGNSAAEMLYGQALRIPGDFCDYLEPEIDTSTFMNKYRRHLQEVKPVPTPHKQNKLLAQLKPFYFKDLDKCSHVLKKEVKVKPPLTRPYSGPFKVIRRHPTKKYFEIEVKGDKKAVSTNWLKPAYFIAEDLAERFPEFIQIIYSTPLPPPEPLTLPPPEPPDLPSAPEPPTVVQQKNSQTPSSSTLQNPIQQLNSRIITSTSQLPKIRLPSHISLPTNFEDNRTSSTETVLNQNVQQTEDKPKKRVRFIPNIVKRKKL